MESVYLRLYPANKKCKNGIAWIHSKEPVIFENAATKTNEGSGFKRGKKKIEIIEIKDYLDVKITSELPLQMASKNLAGFSRILLAGDDIREEGGKERLFDDMIYNHSLFTCEVIEPEEQIKASAEEISDSEALKMIIDLFYGDTSINKEQNILRKDTMNEIKETIVRYQNKKKNKPIDSKNSICLN